MQTSGEGVKNPETFADVICTWPLDGFWPGASLLSSYTSTYSSSPSDSPSVKLSGFRNSFCSLFLGENSHHLGHDTRLWKGCLLFLDSAIRQKYLNQPSPNNGQIPQQSLIRLRNLPRSQVQRKGRQDMPSNMSATVSFCQLRRWSEQYNEMWWIPPHSYNDV